MTTVAGIAKKAMDAVALKITDAVHAGSLSYDTQGAYDFDTGAYATTTTTITGRVVLVTDKPISDIFPDYVVGPKDQLVLLEGFSSVPAENWTLTFKGTTYVVMQVQDVAAAGTLFMAVVR